MFSLTRFSCRPCIIPVRTFSTFVCYNQVPGKTKSPRKESESSNVTPPPPPPVLISLISAPLPVQAPAADAGLPRAVLHSRPGPESIQDLDPNDASESWYQLPVHEVEPFPWWLPLSKLNAPPPTKAVRRGRPLASGMATPVMRRGRPLTSRLATPGAIGAHPLILEFCRQKILVRALM